MLLAGGSAQGPSRHEALGLLLSTTDNRSNKLLFCCFEKMMKVASICSQLTLAQQCRVLYQRGLVFQDWTVLFKGQV
jgi:hypothetical protein